MLINKMRQMQLICTTPNTSDNHVRICKMKFIVQIAFLEKYVNTTTSRKIIIFTYFY